ncbi:MULTISPECIES: glycosyltransferase family 4 protein [unclassified Exiguobacterium]|uniref:glycosyltransferase family 4 protein n=1 Tax=unclassified Exiguobacterium TaxID=2644629 RepID=UPI001BE7830C
MKKVVILSNHDVYTYNFRKEIIQKLLEEKFEVHLVLPYGEKLERLIEMGCIHHNVSLDRRGMNPFKDLKLLYQYYKVINKILPDAIISYTVKPNVYGGLIARLKKVPFFPNVTGLGSGFEKKGITKKILLNLYKASYKKATCVFFQNKEDKRIIMENGVNINKYKIIPGSGVNISEFPLLPYPDLPTVNFVYISRIMKEKGIDQFLEAAQYIKRKHPYTMFHVLGFCEQDYESKLHNLQELGILKYHGMQDNVREFHKISSCTIHPTYYPEGMSNVLLETAASGRPIITTNRSGTKEIVDNEINGYFIEQENSEDLIDKIEIFLSLNFKQKEKMGLMGRQKIMKEFRRELVVDAYLDELRKIN